LTLTEPDILVTVLVADDNFGEVVSHRTHDQ
jgi:hypothetical protein